MKRKVVNESTLGWREWEVTAQTRGRCGGGMVCRTRSRNERERMMRSQVRGECSVERKQKKDCGRFWRTVGTEENVGQGYPDCTRIRKHSTSRRVTHAPPPGTGEKRMESAESENGQLRRNECMGGEVRERTGCVVLTCRRTTCGGNGGTF